MKYLVVLALCMFFLSGCVTVAAVNKRLDEKVAAWKAAHPDEKMTDEIYAQLVVEAAAEVDKEMAEAREEAAKKLAEGISAFSTGNVVGAVAALLALLGISVGAYKKMKG